MSSHIKRYADDIAMTFYCLYSSDYSYCSVNLYLEVVAPIFL